MSSRILSVNLRQSDVVLARQRARQIAELLMSLQHLRRQHEELAHLNQELQDTNRGVVALYAEPT